MQLRTWSLSVIIFILLLTGCELGQNQPKAPVVTETNGEELLIHFIDVGQGDATLFQGPDFTILVDAGRHDRSDVVPYLQQVGVTKFDLVVGTHPHADHIGQMDQVLKAFPTKEVWMSGDEHTTRTFERTIDAIMETDAEYYEPRAGETFEIGSLFIEVVNPEELTTDFHEGSLSMKLTYGEVSILLTGDAEKQTEEWILSQRFNLTSTIFQLGHHGSSTSNTEAFLEAVDPQIAIYSAGKNNEYGHPHREVIERLNGMNIPVYGTDQQGTIVIITDGKDLELHTEHEVNQEVNLDEERADGNEEEVNLIDGDLADSREECININNATLEDLIEIVHIGDERVEQLLAFRPFEKIEDLTKINGIGSGRLAEIIEQGLACLE
ncbi:MBL fold metallo-hydrolase [Alkalihalobacterium alkalinitrilicum]|uniref:MBL fold metallo-hydrolase n=1 Tax=Alkalihalobacterium alkalinitrilicum TaxID=427920 RepID=UPI000995260A|nr:MBL fold metallo-hydrolase [Alkalihalobacterium alkalinitrilicum]